MNLSEEEIEVLEDVVLDYLDELGDQSPRPYLFLIGRTAEERFFHYSLLPLSAIF